MVVAGSQNEADPGNCDGRFFDAIADGESKMATKATQRPAK
jgi:hypothetical protein